MKTTLNAIRNCIPCTDGWKKLLSHLGKTAADDEPVELLTILNSNGVADALWCLRAVENHDTIIRKLACDFALSVSGYWNMPDAVRVYLETQDESSQAAAYAAADYAATNAAASAAYAANAAAYAAYAAAAYAANAAYAAYAAADAAANAAYAASVSAAERVKQEAMLRAIL